jgi:ISXO2-like transposase domain/Transposase zinc-ribbon domain
VDQPRAGVHYRRSVGELQAWFRADDDCLDYLEWLRWPDGFVGPRCGHGGGWRMYDARFKCAGCGVRTSVAAGTIFDRTRTPLMVWFTACWLFASGKDGISALSLQRTLEIGSYQTVWAMLHRLRSVLVRPGRERLNAAVEVDETFIGGEEPGLRGGRQRGKKVLTCIAVEINDPKGLGRCRMAPIEDASASPLHAFVTDHVEPGSTVITDGWSGYLGLDRLGCGAPDRLAHQAVAARYSPGLDRRRPPTRLHDEFVFRFNRRNSRSRGLVFYRVLQLAVDHDPAATRTSSSPSTRARPRRRRRPAAGSHPAWNDAEQIAHGAELPCDRPVRWIPHGPFMASAKILLAAPLLLAGSGVSFLLRHRGFAATFVGSVPATWNPYVAEGLLLGQSPTLVGYAMIPWLIAAVRSS